MRIISTANVNQDALTRTKSITGSTDEQVLTAINSGAPTRWSSVTDALREYRKPGSNVSREALLANVYRICCAGRQLMAT